MSVLRVDGPAGGPRYFTLLRNTAHANVAHLAREKSELLPDENTLTVVPGFIGAYPNAIYPRVGRTCRRCAAAIAGLASEADYRKLADRFAIRRTDPQFWAASDALHDAYAAMGAARSRPVRLQPIRRTAESCSAGLAAHAGRQRSGQLRSARFLFTPLATPLPAGFRGASDR